MRKHHSNITNSIPATITAESLTLSPHLPTTSVLTKSAFFPHSPSTFFVSRSTHSVAQHEYAVVLLVRLSAVPSGREERRKQGQTSWWNVISGGRRNGLSTFTRSRYAKPTYVMQLIEESCSTLNWVVPGWGLIGLNLQNNDTEQYNYDCQCPSRRYRTKTALFYNWMYWNSVKTLKSILCPCRPILRAMADNTKHLSNFLLLSRCWSQVRNRYYLTVKLVI